MIAALQADVSRGIGDALLNLAHLLRKVARRRS